MIFLVGTSLDRISRVLLEGAGFPPALFFVGIRAKSDCCVASMASSGCEARRYTRRDSRHFDYADDN